jgi:hypothetical protein
MKAMTVRGSLRRSTIGVGSASHPLLAAGLLVATGGTEAQNEQRAAQDVGQKEMKTLAEHNLVRVIWLENEPRRFIGSPGVARPPRLGDIGAIVNTYSATTFAVECIDAQGMTVWLADFHLGEIESIDGTPVSK